MPTEARLTLLDDNGLNGEAAIFIHGYRTITSPEEFLALRQIIMSTQPGGRVYLLHWKSGSWALTKAMAMARGTYRAVRYAKMLNPWSFALDAGLLVASESAQFKLMERRAEVLGEELQQHLDEFPDLKYRPINLVGHSLGARVIHFALARNQWSEYPIHDCVFLGGAADLEADNWHDCLGQIHGQLFNGYSARDRVLPWTPDLRRRVGSQPMPSVVVDGRHKVINKNCGRCDHGDYWRRLDYLLPKIWTRFRDVQEQHAGSRKNRS